MSLFTLKGNFQPTISLVCFPQPLTPPVWKKVMNYKRYKMMPRNFYWPQTGLLFHNCNCRLCLLEHKYIFKLKQLPWCLWWVLNGTLTFWSLLDLGKLRALEGYSGEERRLLSQIFCKAMSPGEPWPWAMSWIPSLDIIYIPRQLSRPLSCHQGLLWCFQVWPHRATIRTKCVLKL